MSGGCNRQPTASNANSNTPPSFGRRHVRLVNDVPATNPNIALLRPACGRTVATFSASSSNYVNHRNSQPFGIRIALRRIAAGAARRCVTTSGHRIRRHRLWPGLVYTVGVFSMFRHLGFCFVAVAAVGALLATGSTANARHHSCGSSGGVFGGSHGGNGSHGGRGSHGGFGGLFHRGSSDGGCGSTGGCGSHAESASACGCGDSDYEQEGNHEHSDDQDHASTQSGNDHVMGAPRETHRAEYRDADDGSANAQDQKSSDRDEAQKAGAAPNDSPDDSAKSAGDQNKSQGDENKAQQDANDKNKEQTNGTKEEKNNPTPGNAEQSK